MAKIPQALPLSCGVAIFPEHGTTAEEILRAADEALYQAKARREKSRGDRGGEHRAGVGEGASAPGVRCAVPGKSGSGDKPPRLGLQFFAESGCRRICYATPRVSNLSNRHRCGIR